MDQVNNTKTFLIFLIGFNFIILIFYLANVNKFDFTIKNFLIRESENNSSNKIESITTITKSVQNYTSFTGNTTDNTTIVRNNSLDDNFKPILNINRSSEINLHFCTYIAQVFPNDTNNTKQKNRIDKTELSFEEIGNNIKNKSIQLVDGGKSYTEINSGCNSTGLKYKRIAFIIPYRDRLKNLKLFLNNMHEFFIRHNISYGVYLVEPEAQLTFNRGLLMNIGFLESIKDSMRANGSNSSLYWDCFIFHDVDMIPEDERLFYTCDPDYPVHYAVAVSKFGYATSGYFEHYFGGITAFTKEQYESIHGFSNLYFGWGGEDDDLYARATYKYKKIIKLPKDIARYYMHDHDPDQANPDRFNILAQAREKIKKNGIQEGLFTIKYELKSTVKEYLFTKFVVFYNKSAFFK